MIKNEAVLGLLLPGDKKRTWTVHCISMIASLLLHFNDNITIVTAKFMALSCQQLTA